MLLDDTESLPAFSARSWATQALLEHSQLPFFLPCLLRSHSSNRYFLGTYSVPPTVLGAGNPAAGMIDLWPRGQHSVGGDKAVRKINNRNSMLVSAREKKRSRGKRLWKGASRHAPLRSRQM